MIDLVLALQESAAPPPAVMLDIHFDLAHPLRASPDANVIVVRGRRLNLRLVPLPEMKEEQLLPKAETRLFGGVAKITTESKELLGGVTSPRIMIRWGLKF